jgi:hypothetical protein
MGPPLFRAGAPPAGRRPTGGRASNEPRLVLLEAGLLKTRFSSRVVHTGLDSGEDGGETASSRAAWVRAEPWQELRYTRAQ